MSRVPDPRDGKKFVLIQHHPCACLAIGGKLFHVGEIDGLDAQNVYNVNTLGHIYLYRAAYPIFVANRKAGDGKPPVFLAVRSRARGASVRTILSQLRRTV